MGGLLRFGRSLYRLQDGHHRVCCRVVMFTKKPKNPALSLTSGKYVQNIADVGSGITTWRVLEDHSNFRVMSVGQPVLDELWDYRKDYGPGAPTQVQAQCQLLDACVFISPSDVIWLAR